MQCVMILNATTVCYATAMTVQSVLPVTVTNPVTVTSALPVNSAKLKWNKVNPAKLPTELFVEKIKNLVCALNFQEIINMLHVLMNAMKIRTVLVIKNVVII